MASFLRKMAFVLSICLFLSFSPVFGSGSATAHAASVPTNAQHSVTPHVTCPPPPYACW